MDLALGPLMAPPNAPGRNAAVVLTIAVHVLLAVLLIYGIRWQKQLPEPVAVELVSAVPPAPTSEPKPAPPPEPVRAAEPKPEPKPVPSPRPDIAIKEKEKPKPPAKPVPQPKVDPFAEQLKREAEQLQQKRASDAAASELSKLKADQAAAASSRAIADYLGRIRGKIRGNIVLPPDVKGNPEAVFDVTQLPSGEILGVRLRKSSGHAALDAAIERAILKSSPLPKPDKADLFSRALELKFRPLDD